jgi:tRNA isopentenyl-2-thiomethyl-A-37 hydroxylase MiaE
LLPKGSASKDDKSWDPVSVPAPNYANSSKAVPRRVIDLTIPGAWSEAQEKIMREVLAPSADKIFDQEVADQYEEHLRSNRAAGQ